MPFSLRDLPHRAVMGVVNVTPDSFSDGGRFFDADAAVAHGLALAAAGADVIDVGGESTRPGAAPVEAGDEIARVVPVIERLAPEVVAAISIDTRHAAVAQAALAAGASLVNDVSAGRDEEMLHVVARAGAGYVAMHMRGEPATMQRDLLYQDVVDEVGAFLAERAAAARRAGVTEVIVDPGIGFGKTGAHNLALLAALDHLGAVAEAPVLVGASRKSFLGALLGGADVGEREEATLATTVWAFTRGAAMVRVHDVATTVRVSRLLDVVESATPEGVSA